MTQTASNPDGRSTRVLVSGPQRRKLVTKKIELPLGLRTGRRWQTSLLGPARDGAPFRPPPPFPPQCPEVS